MKLSNKESADSEEDFFPSQDRKRNMHSTYSPNDDNSINDESNEKKKEIGIK